MHSRSPSGDGPGGAFARCPAVPAPTLAAVVGWAGAPIADDRQRGSEQRPRETPAGRFAYLHGFASGPLSRKGRFLAERLAPRGVDLRLPDLNRPSFSRLTVSGALAAVDEMAAGSPARAPWRLVGSSFGGYVAARWAELHPERVDRLLLLCPGFGILDWWPNVLGDEAMARWERDGELTFPDGAGVPTPVHWAFVEDVRRHPPAPDVPCPTRIVHGTRDEVVPIEGSRRYAAGRRHVSLLEVDDDHALTASLATVAAEAESFLLSG